MSNDTVEFYEGPNILTWAKSSIVPPVGALLSIRGLVYRAIRVTYAVDYADQANHTTLRANVDVERALTTGIPGDVDG